MDCLSLTVSVRKHLRSLAACSYVAGGFSYLVSPDGEVCEGGVSPESLGQLT